MTTSQRNAALGLLLAAAAAYTATVYPHLPDPLPIHWNLRGEPDGWASRPWAFFGLGLMALVTLLLIGLARLTPARFSREAFAPAYRALTVVVAALLGSLHVLALQAALDREFDLIRAIVVVGLLFLAVMGTLMPRLRQNPWAGIRTPWSLASEANWNETHRFAGRWMMTGGVAGAVLVAAGASPLVGLAVLLVAVLAPVWKSYSLTRA